jgi:uncharacterized tellurite resistance protein B-like protein
MTTQAHLKIAPPKVGPSQTSPPQNTHQLVKILIGAAWLDGKVQLEEREYVKRIAQEAGVATDREIYPLLHGLRAVSPEECYQWIDEYLGEQPQAEDCQQLLEALSGLIYSDGSVAIEEAKLLSSLQSKEQNCSTCTSRGILAGVSKLYRRWVAAIESY